ncbi:BfmA/BtgA family mobilization protein [Pedobacter sp. FW305-3-2-15-E-R2A2]|uniref:BfmA/BtgA family mobilization protein n=1 Tax=Pedobacter sp. FW305-3-2-15-E-R2A2 TaxID=3140251 RepID=UPI00314024D2
MQESLRTVKYSASDAIKFEKVALKLCRSKRLVFTQMVDYFYRSKKDPKDLNDELLKNTILKGQKEYFGFIKTQEAELLIPIKRDVARVVDSQKTIMGCFNSQVLQYNNDALKNQNQQVLSLARIQEFIKGISDKVDEKEKLKVKFLSILDTYIRLRDSFGLMTSGKDKEVLIDNTRKQVAKL